MNCKKCGADIGEAKFCTECGEQAEETAEALQTQVGTSADNAEAENKDELLEAMNNLRTFEDGSIPHPDEKEENKKRSLFCWKNPMLAAAVGLFLFAAALGIVDVIFFSVKLEGAVGTIYRIAFLIMALFVLAADIIFYLRPAYRLDRMFKGKGIVFEYRLKNYELVDAAEKAKKKNRGFYIAIALFGLAFASYYAYLIVSVETKSALLWISFCFSALVAVIFTLFFFLLPKLNYNRMMENGEKVIIGEKSVYYGGKYHWWTRIEPKLTFGKYNSKTHILTLTFAKTYKNGKVEKKKLELFAPERELASITKLLSLYEINIKEYQLKEQRNSILSDTDEKDCSSRKED